MTQLLIQSFARPKSLCAFNPKHLDKYIWGSICCLVLFAYFPDLTSTVTFFSVSKWADSVVATLGCHVTYQMSQLWDFSPSYNHTVILLHGYIPNDGFCQGINRNQLWSIEINLEIQITYLFRVFLTRLSLAFLFIGMYTTIIAHLMLVNNSTLDFAS